MSYIAAIEGVNDVTDDVWGPAGLEIGFRVVVACEHL